MNVAHTLGLFPLENDCAMATLAPRLAAGLHGLRGDRVALIAGWTQGTSGLDHQEQDFRESPAPFGTMVVPPAEPDAVLATHAIARAIDSVRPRHAYVIADLSGLPIESPLTQALIDKVIALVPSGRVSDRSFIQLRSSLVDPKKLVALLIDAG